MVFLIAPALADKSQQGVICVAPFDFQSADPRLDPVEGLRCTSGKLSLKVDAHKAIPWPSKESIRMDGFDFNQRHRVVVLCDNKPQQSFSFRFSELKSSRLCLFINDLYKTVQLWDAKGSPWC